jgi:hypothetical protein
MFQGLPDRDIIIDQQHVGWLRHALLAFFVPSVEICTSRLLAQK